jgi:hypothetical protein
MLDTGYIYNIFPPIDDLIFSIPCHGSKLEPGPLFRQYFAHNKQGIAAYSIDNLPRQTGEQ